MSILLSMADGLKFVEAKTSSASMYSHDPYKQADKILVISTVA